MSEAQDPIRLVIVNDYDLVVNGVAKMLETFQDRVCVVELEAGGLPDTPADIALFDTFAGRRQSLRRIRQMAQDADISRLVLYTWDIPEAFAGEISEHDVDGVILKSATGAALVDAIERVHRGEPVGEHVLTEATSTVTLTEREREVLALIARGFTNRRIADELYLSLDTVKTHVRKLFRKLGVDNRTQAAMLAADHHLTIPA